MVPEQNVRDAPRRPESEAHQRGPGGKKLKLSEPLLVLGHQNLSSVLERGQHLQLSLQLAFHIDENLGKGPVGRLVWNQRSGGGPEPLSTESGGPFY